MKTIPDKVAEATAILSQMTPSVLQVCLTQTQFALTVQNAAQKDEKKKDKKK